MLPAFGIMLALAITYASLGATPMLRSGLAGLGPVVLGIFVVAVYRLSKAEVTTVPQLLIAITAAAAALWSPLGMGPIITHRSASVRHHRGTPSDPHQYWDVLFLRVLPIHAAFGCCNSWIGAG